MADPDPELQAILQRKASSLRAVTSFYERVNHRGVTEINDDNIDDIIRSSPLPVIVDFSADAWCKPCKVMAPIYEELSQDFVNKVIFLKINTDHNPQASGKYRIGSVPTFMIFYKGNRLTQRIGAIAKVKFKTWINEVLEKLDNLN